MPADRLVKVTFQITTPESAAAGDFAETGWIDEEGSSVEPDRWDLESGVTAVDKAVELILENGPVEASSSRFHPGVWFTQTNPTQNRDFFENGVEETHSFHLEGFTVEEQREVFRRVS